MLDYLLGRRKYYTLNFLKFSIKLSLSQNTCSKTKYRVLLQLYINYLIFPSKSDEFRKNVKKEKIPLQCQVSTSMI